MLYTEDQLCQAMRRNNAQAIKEMIADPEFDINRQSIYGQWTVLHWAAARNQLDIVKILLANPLVRTDIRDVEGQTALHHAFEGREPQHPEITQHLWHTTYLRYLQQNPTATMATTFAALDHEIFFKFHYRFDDTDAYADVMFKKANRMNKAIRERKASVFAGAEKAHQQALAAQYFATVIFKCDGLLTEATELPELPQPQPILRFFNIASRLPIELQMVLCERTAGSGQNLIASQHREDALGELARAYPAPK